MAQCRWLDGAPDTLLARRHADTLTRSPTRSPRQLRTSLTPTHSHSSVSPLTLTVIHVHFVDFTGKRVGATTVETASNVRCTHSCIARATVSTADAAATVIVCRLRDTIYKYFFRQVSRGAKDTIRLLRVSPFASSWKAGSQVWTEQTIFPHREVFTE